VTEFRVDIVSKHRTSYVITAKTENKAQKKALKCFFTDNLLRDNQKRIQAEPVVISTGKYCIKCGEHFFDESQSKHAKYCNQACRMSSWREKTRRKSSD